MYWYKLDESDRRDLAHHIYLAALCVTDTDGARGVCRDALERVGPRAAETEQLAQLTHERYLQVVANVDVGKYGR